MDDWDSELLTGRVEQVTIGGHGVDSIVVGAAKQLLTLNVRCWGRLSNGDENSQRITKIFVNGCNFQEVTFGRNSYNFEVNFVVNLTLGASLSIIQNHNYPLAGRRDQRGLSITAQKWTPN